MNACFCTSVTCSYACRNIVNTIKTSGGASGGVMVSKPTRVSSSLIGCPLSYDLVPHLSKKLSKFPIKTSGHTPLEKYTSHFIRKVYERVIVSEVSWRLNKTETYWPPALLAITALLSRSPGLLNRGPWGPSLAGTWFSLLELQQLTPNSDLQLTNFLSHRIIWLFGTHLLQWASHLHPTQHVNSQGYPPISSTGCTCYLHECISYLTARPGRRSICYTSFVTGNQAKNFWASQL